MRVDSVQVSSVRGYSGSGKIVSHPKKTYQTPYIRMVTFTGNNMWQIASLTPENSGLGLPEAYQGGEGVVGYSGNSERCAGARPQSDDNKDDVTKADIIIMEQSVSKAGHSLPCVLFDKIEGCLHADVKKT